MKDKFSTEVKTVKYDQDTDLKPEMMKSMSLPWTPSPLYSTKAQDTTPHTARHERRSRKIQRFFWHMKDDINLAIVILAVFGGSVILWLAVAEVLSWTK